MGHERNRRLIDIWYRRMWNEWDKAVFAEILSTAIVLRGSLGQLKHGYAGVSEYMDFVRAAFADFHNQIEEIISEGDKAFARLTYTATHTGELFGIAPSQKRIQYAGAAVFTFATDKIADVWVLGDLYSLLKQLSPTLTDHV